jgi:alkyl sulfatase BDS1-like metallo-beta-lactamase superfamily hydrolase
MCETTGGEHDGLCFIAITAIVHPAQSQQTKPAEPNVAAANQAVQSQLPFNDRQDFEDAMRGFIASERVITLAGLRRIRPSMD